jgi:hypothetical protein
LPPPPLPAKDVKVEAELPVMQGEPLPVPVRQQSNHKTEDVVVPPVEKLVEPEEKPAEEVPKSVEEVPKPIQAEPIRSLTT